MSCYRVIQLASFTILSSFKLCHESEKKSEFTSLKVVEMATASRQLSVFLFLAVLLSAGDNIPNARVWAADPDPLQDFCIADVEAGGPSINGYPCLAANLATAENFSYSGLAASADLSGLIDRAQGSLAFVQEWPALNTLGLSIARLDFVPGGIIMPHTHPLATEILYCMEGEIYTGFVTNSDNPIVPNKLYAKIVKKGEAFIFPRGLMHFQLNKGTVNATSINVLNSQNPGFQKMPIALFSSGIDPELLSKSFFITEAQVAQLTNSISQVVNQ